jgi:protein TonB
MEHAMVRTDLIPKKRKDPPLARHAGPFAASCFLHATFFGLLLWLTLLYRANWMPPPSGSQANPPSITLSTLVITPPAPTPPIPKLLPPLPKPPTREMPVVATTPANVIPQPPQPRPAPVEHAIPVLTAPPSKPAAVAQTPRAPATAVAKASPAKPKPAAPASFASSYAPGENLFPHPPYPEDAENLRETGTVVMAVTFNTAGDVARAEVSQSSGIWLLDTNTRSFILTHWHSTTFAGRTVTQPVRYTGE